MTLLHRTWLMPASGAEHAKQLHDRIVELVYDALLQRDDRIVGDRDALGTDFRAALGDVAISDAVRGLQVSRALLGIERMHFERCGIDEVPRSDELVEQRMVAEHVADILAEEALDALPELLHALHVDLSHPP